MCWGLCKTSSEFFAHANILSSWALQNAIMTSRKPHLCYFSTNLKYLRGKYKRHGPSFDTYQELCVCACGSFAHSFYNLDIDSWLMGKELCARLLLYVFYFWVITYCEVSSSCAWCKLCFIILLGPYQILWPVCAINYWSFSNMPRAGWLKMRAQIWNCNYREAIAYFLMFFDFIWCHLFVKNYGK